MRQRRTIAAVLFPLMLLPAVAFAQASIAGTVKDTSGAVLPGVTVEAASPALIEKTRSVVTDGTGQFKIENLRPGAYSVTFTLVGFNTVKREGIELSGSFTATVNGEMKVGAVEETITVTGEAPVVDVQSATKERVLSHDVTDQIPAGRLPTTYATLIPGVIASASSGPNSDVGGSQLSGNLTKLGIHGIGTGEMRATQNGVTWNTVATGSSTPALPNMAAIQEVAVDYSAMSADAPEGGIRINYIPRDGGNVYHGTFFGSFANSSLASNNYTSDLSAAGLKAPDSLKQNFDVNPGIGGPISKDRLWFYVTARYNGSALYTGGMFYNLNANNPNAWTYAPDLSRQASNDSVWKDGQGRLTWQINPKNKLAVSYDQQTICNCLSAISATASPEAGRYWYFPLERSGSVEWTSPLTNRVLVEGVMFTRFERYIMQKVPGLNPLMINTTDQFNGLTYRALNTYANNWTPNLHYRFSLAYVTGAHSLKFGFNDGGGSVDTYTYDNQPVSYQVNSVSGVPVPNQITERATPYDNKSSIDHETGLFAQDKWTMNRLTATVGVRYDHFLGSYPAVTLGPGPLVPTRNFSFPDTPNRHYSDLTPRLGVSYDLFGDGKTAIKASVNKYLLGQSASGLGVSPVSLLVLSTTRSWTDTNKNFIPDCNLLNPAAQTVAGGDTCGAMANAAFGTQVPGASVDPNVLGGWGHRGYNWEFATGVQREIMPRVSVDLTYFRRIFGNLLVTDNLAVAASDYNAFSLTAPADPRLPGGGGYIVSGLYNLSPAKFGIPSQNYTTFADNYGSQQQHWNGIDFTVNARPAQDILLQGGVSSGKFMTDNCAVAAQIPESLLGDASSGVINAGAPGTATPASVLTPLQYCHQETPFLTQVKLIGSYMVPKIGVQVAGTVQSVPGPILNANNTVANALVAPALGRSLSGNAANITYEMISPGTLVGQRLNQLDLRFAKVFKISNVRAAAQLDVYNALNGNAVLTQNDSYGVWQTPTSILIARFVKFGIQLDF